MYKKTVKIGFPSFVWQDFRDYIVDMLKPRFDVRVCKDYDYFFANELIYQKKENMQEFISCRNEAIRFLSLGECIYPDFNITDYALCSRKSDFESARQLYIPYENLQIPFLFDSVSELDKTKEQTTPEQILKEKTKFCNFIYANPNAHPMRDKLFYKISEYKRVDSLGKHLNNVRIENTRNDTNWGKISIELKRPYKFSIAAENAKFAGYTSEKLITSMLANTIPIYFGNPTVANEYNPKSFINVSDFDTLDDLAAYVKEIDKNDDLYCQIMSEPWRTPEQIERFEENTNRFYEEFSKIFETDLKHIKRRPEGMWPDKLYPEFITSQYGEKVEGLGFLRYMYRWLKRKIPNLG